MIDTNRRGVAPRALRRAVPLVQPLELRLLLATGPLVDTLADQNDGAGVNGTSLREAVQIANINGGIIAFDPALTASGPATITLSLGELLLDDGKFPTTTIDGPGASLLSISGANAARVFSIASLAVVEIKGLTITGGNATDAGFSSKGGGILNHGALTLTGVIVAQNHSQGDGGGVYNDGNLTLTDTTISTNTASFGAGLYNAATLTLTRSTVAANTADGQGGGISNTATLTATNSTLANNTANGNAGGGLHSSGSVILTNCTVSGNQSATAGGGIASFGPTFTLNNTIVAANTGSAGVTLSDIAGSPTGANNLVGVDTGLQLVFNGVQDGVNGNKVGTSANPIDPLLSPLADNGGPTRTMAILPASPAFNAGSNALIPGGVTTDQRGQPRIAASTVDIGAFEVQPGNSLLVTSLGDEDNGTSDPAFGIGTTLREAIAYANGHAGADTITFVPQLLTGGPATITLSLGQLLLNDTTGKTTITGLGARLLTIHANNASRVFEIPAGASADISSLTITGGNASGAGFASTGGGILNRGTLTLTNTVVYGNQASASGGGITNTGALTLTGVSVSSNSSNSSGGISNGGTLTISKSILWDNASSNQGGAIFSGAGTLSITDSTVSGNVGESGGIFVNGGTVTLLRCNVTGNSTTGTGAGGGLFIENGITATLNNTTIAGNKGPASVADDIRGAVAGSNNTIGVNTGLTGITNNTSGNKLGAAAKPLVPAVAPIVVTTLADEDDASADPSFGGGTSLREALRLANARTTADTITFAPALTASGAKTITLTLGQLLVADMDGTTTFAGPGANRLSINGNNLSRIFEIDGWSSAHISGLTLTGGNAEDGGAILNNGTLTVAAVAFAANNSGNRGGAITNSGTLTVTNSTFSANIAQYGGGIFSTSILTVSNSTFSANSVMATGGGLYVYAGSATITNSTFTANSSGDGGGVARADGTLTLNNTIVAGNTGLVGSPDVIGAFAGRFNLIGNGTNMTGLTNGVQGNKVGTSAAPLNPRLAPLANNGGPTKTHALLPGSPAINGAHKSLLVGATTDHRSLPRNAGGAPDIGAFEYQKSLLLITGTAGKDTITVSATSTNITYKLNNNPPISIPKALVSAVKVSSLAGNDTITINKVGMAATLLAGAGNDSIFCRNTIKDTVDAGTGTDKAKLDDRDTRKGVEQLLA